MIHDHVAALTMNTADALHSGCVIGLPRIGLHVKKLSTFWSLLVPRGCTASWWSLSEAAVASPMTRSLLQHVPTHDRSVKRGGSDGNPTRLLAA
jgi:hypothetical protein